MRRPLLLVASVALVSAAGWLWFVPLGAWRSIERVPFDPAAARAMLNDLRGDRALPPNPAIAPHQPRRAPTPLSGVEAIAPPGVSRTDDDPRRSTPQTSTTVDIGPTPDPVEAAAPPQPTDALDVFLIVGSDEKPDDPDIRADTIMLLIVPEDRSSSMLVSIPRLLYVMSPCTGEAAPINVNLEGCGEVTGLDLVAVAVEDYTGLSIDHLVLLDFAGFEQIVDQIGGFEVCVDHAVKLREHLPIFLEPGCSTLDGSATLDWVRERQTLEQIGGEWRLMTPTGDEGRTARQRELIAQVLQRVAGFGSPSALGHLLTDLSGAFILDESLGLAEALDLAWDFRVLANRPIQHVAIATTGTVTSDGELALISEQPFHSYLDGYG